MCLSNRLPRMRGDPPYCRRLPSASERSTPHARGSTFLPVFVQCGLTVYPACAGIHPVLEMYGTLTPRLPRMRGDPPKTHRRYAYHRESTPHARGSTCSSAHSWASLSVYPACAGIHLNSYRPKARIICLPRMRGDPPGGGLHLAVFDGSTPHARGSTPCPGSLDLLQGVYPACAGIHLSIFMFIPP